VRCRALFLKTNKAIITGSDLIHDTSKLLGQIGIQIFSSHSDIYFKHFPGKGKAVPKFILYHNLLEMGRKQQVP
jgi:hypothetical protein